MRLRSSVGSFTSWLTAVFAGLEIDALHAEQPAGLIQRAQIDMLRRARMLRAPDAGSGR